MSIIFAAAAATVGASHGLRVAPLGQSLSVADELAMVAMVGARRAAADAADQAIADADECYMGCGHGFPVAEPHDCGRVAAAIAPTAWQLHTRNACAKGCHYCAAIAERATYAPQWSARATMADDVASARKRRATRGSMWRR